jgi:hypothetical protein
MTFQRALAFLGVVVLAGCSTASETTESQEAQWVIRPNGTADRATITLKLPSGFAAGLRWTFYFGDKPLEPGVPLLVSTTPREFSARSSSLGVQVLAKDVQARVGFDTELTFGTLDVRTPNLKFYPTDYYEYDTRADIEQSPPSRAHLTLSADASTTVYGADATKDWPAPNEALPFPVGAGKVRIAKGDAATFETEVPFNVKLGQATAIDAVVSTEPVFTVKVHQDDARTMPSVPGAAPASAGLFRIACPNGKVFSEIDPDGSKEVRIYTRTTAQCQVWIGSDYETLTVAPGGGTADVALHRIEVDDITLTDETPSRTVHGTFGVNKILADGSTRAVWYGGDTFPTHRGVVVLSGKYRVGVRYQNAAGETKLLSYESTL